EPWLQGDERSACPLAASASGGAVDSVPRGGARLEGLAEASPASSPRRGTLDGGGTRAASPADLRFNRGVEAVAGQARGTGRLVADSKQRTRGCGERGARAREGKSPSRRVGRPFRNLLSVHPHGPWTRDSRARAKSRRGTLPLARTGRWRICPDPWP